MGSVHSRAIVLGEVTQWGRHYIAKLQSLNVLEFVFENSIEKFLEATHVGCPQIILVENTPASRAIIARLRSSNRRVFLLWFGRVFAKEDLSFAITHRIYSVIEDPKPEDVSVNKSLTGVLHSVDSVVQSEHIIRALKAVLIQHESDEDRPFLSEIKTAIVKLERSALQNEFICPLSSETDQVEGVVPFHQAQPFSDALITVHELERTGVLRVKGGAQQEGEVLFLQGKLICANTGAVGGIKALFRMYLWDDMRFMFTRRDVKSEAIQPDINGDLQELCARGDALRLRFEQMRKEIPPSVLVLAMEPRWMQISTALSPGQFSTLSSVIEFGQVGLVLDYSALSDVDVLESLIALKRARAIKVVAARAPLAL